MVGGVSGGGGGGGGGLRGSLALQWVALPDKRTKEAYSLFNEVFLVISVDSMGIRTQMMKIFSWQRSVYHTSQWVLDTAKTWGRSKSAAHVHLSFLPLWPWRDPHKASTICRTPRHNSGTHHCYTTSVTTIALLVVLQLSPQGSPLDCWRLKVLALFSSIVALLSFHRGMLMI